MQGMRFSRFYTDSIFLLSQPRLFADGAITRIGWGFHPVARGISPGRGYAA